MKSRPILFSAPMVRAILEGRKTQTRRIVKPVGGDDGFVLLDHGNGFWPYRSDDGDSSFHTVKRGGKEYLDETPHTCPYGQPGDQLWVREAHRLLDCSCDTCRVPGYVYYNADCGGYSGAFQGRKRPSIHMPRWASRITLEIVSVRVEKLQDISEADALAEGSRVLTLANPPTYESAKDVYQILWYQINGAGSWNANPWVWCVEFKRIEN